MSRLNFIKRNDGFTCKKCGTKNPPQQSSCRNHCTNCLYSLHVDEETPGDRKSDCKNLMIPIHYTNSGKKGNMIEHMCQNCGKIIKNKLAEDDNMDTFFKYIEQRKITAI